MLEPLSEHDLLLLWAQFAVLLTVARGLGYLFRRFGQPAVIGELAAGLLIGPSVFGRLLPEQAEALFPGGVSASAPILTVAWIGVALLLVETGFETDLGLLRRLGRPAAAVSIGSLVLPLALGFAIGWYVPEDPFIGPSGTRFTFAAFIAVAMSISALPVVARILTELDLMRRNIAQVTVAAAMINDLVGWILLGTLAGIVASGSLAVGQSLATIAAIAVFFTFALTLGQRLVDAALRVSRQASDGPSGPLTVTLLVVLVAATTTQAIGVEAVLGAFVAGIVVGRSPYARADVRRTIELVAAAVFAPIFFASAGMYVDLGALADASGATWTLAIIAVATVAKLGGSYAGALAGGLGHRDGLAIGVGLNARGAMEIVLATVAFALGVFGADAYSIVVLMAMATSLMAPPMLRRALRDVRPQGEEAQRLEREEVLATSVIASTSRALLPTRGGQNARVVASALDLLLQPEAAVTVLTVHDPDATPETCRCDEALGAAAGRFTRRSVERRRRTSKDPSAAILEEAELGYGLVGVGLTEDYRDTHELSVVLRDLITRTRVPLLLVRHGADRSVDPAQARRILVPVTGVRSGRAAEEVGAVLAARLGAHLDLLHVVTHGDDGEEAAGRVGPAVRVRDESSEATAEHVIAQAKRRAERFGAQVSGASRSAVDTSRAILTAGEELGSDLLVLSVRARAVEGQPFLGHGTEHLLENARQTVIAVVFPAEREAED